METRRNTVPRIAIVRLHAAPRNRVLFLLQQLPISRASLYESPEALRCR